MTEPGKRRAEPVTTRIDIRPKTRDAMVALLNKHLADLGDLYSQVKQAHWNVRGPQFSALHELFDRLAERLEAPIDDIAERITALAGVARGTVRMAAATSRLPELPERFDGMALIELLAERYALVAQRMREAIEVSDDADDEVTSDLFTRLNGEIDKALWLLEAHLRR